MDTNDAELLLLYVQRRSEPAFRELAERYTALVYSICLRRLGDRGLAEDATQIVFTVLAAKAKYLEPGPLDGYLARTARYVSSDLLKSRATRRRHEQEFGKMQRLKQIARTPDERLTKLQQVLSELREPYRDAVTLRYMDGLSLEAVGVALDLSPEAVKKRLMRGLAHLRQRMEAQGFGMSLALAAGTLRRLGTSSPPPGLGARITAAIFSSSPPTIARPRLIPRQLALHAALGAGAAVALAAVFADVLLPRVQPPPPIAVKVTLPAGTPSTAIPSLTLKQRLGHKLPELVDHQASFEFTLASLVQMSDIPIDAQWDAIEAVGIKRCSPITLDLHDKTVLEDLDVVLRTVAPPGTLEYVVSASGHIIVRPSSRRDGQTAVLDR